MCQRSERRRYSKRNAFVIHAELEKERGRERKAKKRRALTYAWAYTKHRYTISLYTYPSVRELKHDHTRRYRVQHALGWDSAPSGWTKRARHETRGAAVCTYIQIHTTFGAIKTTDRETRTNATLVFRHFSFFPFHDHS